MKDTTRTGKRNRKRLGMLTFEWILLISLLVIGIIGGLSAVRNALICEIHDLAECIEALNACGCRRGSQQGADFQCEGCDNDPWWNSGDGNL